MGGKHVGGQPGNENRLVHGGEGAVIALSTGRPLKGVALALATTAAERLYKDGPPPLMLQAAARNRAVALLFHGAILEEVDGANLSHYFRRFSWLNSRSFKMMQDCLERGIGDKHALLEEMRQCTIDQVACAQITHGLVVGDPSEVTAAEWGERFQHSNDKAFLMLRTLEDLSRVEEIDVVDYEDILAKEREQ